MNFYWYKQAIFYSLDVETFYDSNNDGTGDFNGLMEKLEYLAGLGITCLWLLPFYPSSNRDNGYDVTDYYTVDPRLGNIGDFSRFMDKARMYGIRVIIDLVVNHTSVQHPWFQQARKSRNSPFRDYYVWADQPVEQGKPPLTFAGEEPTMWTYDEAAGQYYLHRFYREQPDLNIHNPEVRREILKIMGFWLDLGVAGFRIDAAALLIEPYGIPDAEKHELEDFLEEMRAFMSMKRSDAILLAEVNVGPDEMPTYLQSTSRMHMLFDFFTNQHLYLAVAREEAAPLRKAILSLPPVDISHQTLNFLRQHDELTINQLAPPEREEVFTRFGPDRHMRIYEAGIRRRLAPMVNGDQRLLRMMYSLLFSLPGTPLIRYGDEIGMGDDLSLKGRESVRTVMQWTGQPNGGFSFAAADKLVRPAISGGDFGFEKLNVLAAQAEPGSLLNWMVRLITLRKQCPEINTVAMELPETGDAAVFVQRFTDTRARLLIVHNLSGREAAYQFNEPDLTPAQATVLFSEHAAVWQHNSLQLPPYSYFWIKILNPHHG